MIMQRPSSLSLSLLFHPSIPRSTPGDTHGVVHSRRVHSHRRRRPVGRRDISGPKRAQNAIRFLVAFLHTSTHIQARQSSPARTVRVGFASPRLSFTWLSRSEVEITLNLNRSTGDLTTLCLSGPAWLRHNPHTTMCWPSSPPLSAKRARTSETYWRPSKNGMRCCKSLSVGSFIQPCIGIALSTWLSVTCRQIIQGRPGPIAPKGEGQRAVPTTDLDGTCS